ncbi:hypothetical protein AAFF_G00347770 [Aldrovandia affinis]|uniref:Uncharacterized protein n=1 Tax=Aldrovandia affinis TaxID=143900 RepID=A0AAD7SJQ5_9TELE|nr:hypothetical protein AAFF_G00347770 [Aldrovandia affinis]
MWTSEIPQVPRQIYTSPFVLSPSNQPNGCGDTPPVPQLLRREQPERAGRRGGLQALKRRVPYGGIFLTAEPFPYQRSAKLFCAFAPGLFLQHTRQKRKKPTFSCAVTVGKEGAVPFATVFAISLT